MRKRRKEKGSEGGRKWEGTRRGDKELEENRGHHKQISSGVEGCPVNEKLSKYYQTERSGLWWRTQRENSCRSAQQECVMMELLKRFHPPKISCCDPGRSEVIQGGSDRATEIELTDRQAGSCVCVLEVRKVRWDEWERVCVRERRNVRFAGWDEARSDPQELTTVSRQQM